MSAFMGRPGAASGATARAFSPLRRRRRTSAGMGVNKSHRDYLSIQHLRALHGELVETLDSCDDLGESAGRDGGRDCDGGGRSRYSSLWRGGGGKGDTARVTKQELRLIEVIRSISELVAFGEAGEEPQYFDFFSEKVMMALFVRALRLGPAVKTQVVQAVSILFQNIQTPMSLYMLLSQDHINRLIQPVDGTAEELPLHDEEFLTNYVALLKAISVRLSKDTVQFFLNNSKASFPLYSCSVPLIAHPDPMVRTSALNIALHVFSVRDPGVTAFLDLEENHASFFAELTRLMQDAYSQLLCEIWQARPHPAEASSMDGAADSFKDMLYYAQDVLDASDPRISEKLASHLQRTFFRPVVLEGLAEVLAERRSQNDRIKAEALGGTVQEDREPEVQLALYALCQFFTVSTEGLLLVLVAEDLFGLGGPEEGRRTCANRAAAARESTKIVSNDDQRAKRTEELAAAVALQSELRPAHPHSPGRDLDRRRFRHALFACVTGARRCRESEGHRRERPVVRAAAPVGGMALLRIAVNNPLISEMMLTGCRPAQATAVAVAGDADSDTCGRPLPLPEVPSSALSFTAAPAVANSSRSTAAEQESTSEAVVGVARTPQEECCSGSAVTTRHAGQTDALSSSLEATSLSSTQTTLARQSRSDDRRVSGRVVTECDDGEDDDVDDSCAKNRTGVGIQSSVATRPAAALPVEASCAPKEVQAGENVGNGYAVAKVRRSECFEEVMMHLLEALMEPPPVNVLAVRTAASTVEELCFLERSFASGPSHENGLGNASRDRGEPSGGGVAAGNIHDEHGNVQRSPGRLWCPDTGNERFVALLTEAYARSAVVLLNGTTRDQPFALLSACEEGLELLGVGVGMNGHVEMNSPPIHIMDVAGEQLLGKVASETRRFPLHGGTERSEASYITASDVQAFLTVRSLHRCLVEGKSSPQVDASTRPRHAASGHDGEGNVIHRPRSTVSVDLHFLALVGGFDIVQQGKKAKTSYVCDGAGCAEDAGRDEDGGGSNVASPAVHARLDRASPRADEGARAAGEDNPNCASALTVAAPSQRLGGCVHLSGKRCVACCLPYNWPATIGPVSNSAASVAGAPKDGHRTPYTSQELYLVLDNDPSLLLAIPDPDSPLDNGILLCVASLRHTVARILPANPRVVEFRFSTTKDGRVEQREWEPGPGLFLPVSPTAGGNGVSDVGDESGGPSFRGVGHRGLWNLVLTFQSAAASRLVTDHVEEQREATIAARTVGIVEMLRRIASPPSPAARAAVAGNPDGTGDGDGVGGGSCRSDVVVSDDVEESADDCDSCGLTPAGAFVG